jgi:hypothetical protein
LEDFTEFLRVQDSAFDELQDPREILCASCLEGHSDEMLGSNHPSPNSFHFGGDGLLQCFFLQEVTADPAAGGASATLALHGTGPYTPILKMV